MRRTAPAIACALACLAAGTAHAQTPADTVAPPGASAIDEYLETVPTIDGNRTVRTDGKGPKVLTARQRKELAAAGDDGKRVAAFADASGPSLKSRGLNKRGKPEHGGAKPSAGDRPVTPTADGGSGFVSTITRALGGTGGGIGAGLPLLLLATALLAGVVGLRRRGTA